MPANTSAQPGCSGRTGRLNHLTAAGKAFLNIYQVLAECRLGKKPVAFYDLFRVENGKIAEHWNVTEEIPAREQWKNSNGKFGF